MPAIVSGVNSNSQIFYSSYLSTYIERDVKGLSDSIDSLKFLRFITAVAARCGQMLNIAEIARDADINQVQAKNWLGILETQGIIFYLHPYSNNLLKRLVKTSNPGTELVKVFSLLDKSSTPRSKGAVICMKPELGAIDRDNYIVPVWR